MRPYSYWAAISLLLVPIVFARQPEDLSALVSGISLNHSRASSDEALTRDRDQIPTFPSSEAGNTPRSSEATVSIRQLQHQTPSRAKKEFDRGKAALRKRDPAGAQNYFQLAIQIDPTFADAFHGLGLAHFDLGLFREAADNFKKAIDLVPDHVWALANLSIVLCRLETYQEAAIMARRALRLDPRLSQVRYVLALSLARLGNNSDEALENLRSAAADIPKAHLLAAKILAEAGRPGDAAVQAKAYLRSASADSGERQTIEGWIEKLQR